jgi:SepF-like predicted cell division protein (DUF552 family)
MVPERQGRDEMSEYDDLQESIKKLRSSQKVLIADIAEGERKVALFTKAIEEGREKLREIDDFLERLKK